MKHTPTTLGEMREKKIERVVAAEGIPTMRKNDKSDGNQWTTMPWLSSRKRASSIMTMVPCCAMTLQQHDTSWYSMSSIPLPGAICRMPITIGTILIYRKIQLGEDECNGNQFNDTRITLI